ncbi:hypothetical protein PRIPAC_90788 [Pristionchus pacificus]|uniref:Uncharacterized protein n=1 Tax=Pristionchus pacificus TaxID=54126 RepID=A0A2A6CVS5_PRIPA|nr:hypothetical protein PRIPAC_90788 [Pristionchus pacificus]|eukprot:PDM82228.1 hypothetical protein PRIPAC_36621 [Pristionchus pacificus]
MTPEEIQQTRDSIFSSLVDYVSRELSDAEIIAFFILVSKYYSNSPDENKIAKNNMTLKEKESAESVCRNFTNGQFIIHVTSDCSAVLSGLVAFRCELLPELVICRPLTFRDHYFYHEHLFNDSEFCCELIVRYFDDQLMCTSPCEQVVKHTMSRVEKFLFLRLLLFEHVFQHFSISTDSHDGCGIMESLIENAVCTSSSPITAHSIHSLENNSMESQMSREEIQQARDAIFATLPDYASENTTSNQTSEFYTLINKYYANVTDDDRISAGNMTDQEKSIGRSVINRLGYFFLEGRHFCVDDLQAGLAALVTFRCELLPQLIATVEYSSYRLNVRMFRMRVNISDNCEAQQHSPRISAHRLIMINISKIQHSRDSIFSSLDGHFSGSPSEQESIDFFMLINKFFSNISEENKITAENMTNTESYL